MNLINEDNAIDNRRNWVSKKTLKWVMNSFGRESYIYPPPDNACDVNNANVGIVYAKEKSPHQSDLEAEPAQGNACSWLAASDRSLCSRLSNQIHIIRIMGGGGGGVSAHSLQSHLTPHTLKFLFTFFLFCWNVKLLPFAGTHNHGITNNMQSVIQPGN